MASPTAPAPPASITGSLFICQDGSDFELVQAAAADGKPTLKKFSIVGYTGGKMTPMGWRYPAVIDLEGMSIPRQNIPTLYGHDTRVPVGHTESIDKSQKRLKFNGVLSGYSDTEQTEIAIASRELHRLGQNGYPWQASIGASVDDDTFIPEGESAKVNGQNFSGPFYHITKSTLREISLLTLGADGSTSAEISASLNSKGPSPMTEFEKWLKAKSITVDAFNALPDAVKTTLTASHEAEVKAAATPPPAPAEDLKAASAKTGSFEEKMQAIEAENARLKYIEDRGADLAATYIGNPERVSQLRELCASAKEDKHMTEQKFDLALLRFDRASPGPVFFSPKKDQITDEVIEAAVCQAHFVKGHENRFSDQTLQTAHTRFKGGIQLRELLLEAAKRNSNYHGGHSDYRAVCEAAFLPRGAQRDLLASGVSTINVPGILSNVANKTSDGAFLAQERVWAEISRFRQLRDFKSNKIYRLCSGTGFEKLPPGGEIKHTTLTELENTIQLATFATQLGIDRQDLINDDLNAFMEAVALFGTMAAEKLNEVFWTEWLDDASFFSSGNSNLTTDTALAVLNVAGMDAMEAKFRKQTKPNGKVVGIKPAILLTTATQANTATALMSSELLTGLSGALNPDRNVLQGRYRVLDTVYLEDISIAGALTTLWYLIADPNIAAAMNVGFLNGQQTPTIETSQFDFDRLGLGMRGWLDFAAAKGEYRAAQKSNGEAS